MADANFDLQAAIDRNANAVLTLVSQGLTRLHRSRFLAKDDAGLWIGMPAGQEAVLDDMANRGTEARVNFRQDLHTLEFHAVVLERRQHFELNATTHCEAVHLAWPTEVQIVQRRSTYRATLAEPADVRVKVWRIEKEASLTDTPSPGSELNIDVRDFSESGIGGVWKRRAGESPLLPSDQRLRVDIITPAGTTHIDAFVRFLAGLPDPDYRRIGIQFMLNANNLPDRTKMSALGRIMGQLQRAELKRLKTAR